MSSLVNKVKDAVSGHHDEESRTGKRDVTDSERSGHDSTGRTSGIGAGDLNPKYPTSQGQSNVPGSFPSHEESLPSRHKDGREYISPSGTAVGQGHQSGYNDSYASGRGTNERNVMDPASEQRGSNVMGGATSGIGGERYEDQSHQSKLHKREDPRYEESSSHHHQSKHHGHGHGHESERKAVPEDQSRSGYGADSSQYSRHGGANTAAGEGIGAGYGGDLPLASKEFAERRRHPESSKHTGHNDEHRLAGDSSGLGSSGRNDQYKSTGNTTGLGSSGRHDQYSSDGNTNSLGTSGRNDQYSSTGITGNTVSSSGRNDQYSSTGATSGFGSSGRDNYGSSGRHEGGIHNTVVGVGSGEDVSRSHQPQSGLTSSRGAESRETGDLSRSSGAAGMAGAGAGAVAGHHGGNRDEHKYGSERERRDIASEGRGADPMAYAAREGQSGQPGYSSTSAGQPGYSGISAGQPGYSTTSRSEQPMTSSQQVYPSSSGQPGYSNTSGQQHHIVGGQQGYGSSREQQPMASGQTGYGDMSQQSSYATPGMGADMHQNRRVMHKCTGCGQDEDISHYFKKDGVYRMDQ